MGGTGSRRDTSGVLVVGVSDDGPAAKAGIEEGDRIAAINGVDLRVAREDAGDWQASRARINRLNREMEKAKTGDAIELRVYSNGQTRTVRVEAARAADVRSDGAAFHFDDFTGALQRLRRLQALPGGAIRIRPRGSADVEVLPKVDVERRIRAAREALKSALQTRPLPMKVTTTARRAAAG